MAAASRQPAESSFVLDSSCWLEYFADSAYAGRFESVILKPTKLIVPIITIYEVVKKMAREQGDERASVALGLMQQGRVVALDMKLTLLATTLNLPLADSLIYATAQQFGATLWTQDAHFDGMPGVKYFPKT